MKKTKEWISDYLRYFLLLLAIALLVVLIVITLKVYQRYDRTPGQDDIEILTEAQTGRVTETETESETETEAPTETETETVKETETDTADETETEVQTNADSAHRNTAGASDTSDAQTSTGAGETSQTQQSEQTTVQTEAQPIEIQVEEPAAVESTADYRTILSTCNLRSYPDYGDNVIGECYTGQTVEFLGEEEGWYKISVDGVVGYIGPKFLG
jgi:cytoskeletal protein RodZ